MAETTGKVDQRLARSSLRANSLCRIAFFNCKEDVAFSSALYEMLSEEEDTVTFVLAGISQRILRLLYCCSIEACTCTSLSFTFNWFTAVLFTSCSRISPSENLFCEINKSESAEARVSFVVFS